MRTGDLTSRQLLKMYFLSIFLSCFCRLHCHMFIRDFFLDLKIFFRLIDSVNPITYQPFFVSTKPRELLKLMIVFKGK